MSQTDIPADAAAAGEEGQARRGCSNSDEFMSQAFENEDKARWRWWLKIGKANQEAAIAAETGEPRIVRVMRKRIMDGAPIPSASFANVLEFKARNYRMRKPQDLFKIQVQEAIERVGAFNPTLSQEMYPLPPNTCFNSTYIKERLKLKPELKFRFPPSAGTQYGFRLDDFIDQTTKVKSEHSRRTSTSEFYSKAGSLPAPAPNNTILLKNA